MSKVYSKKEKFYNPGQIIFSEDDECDGMYIIISGKVRIFKTICKGDKKTELDLVQLGPNSMFGEMALIDEKTRSASIQAIESTRVIIITKAMFKDQIDKIPLWMQNLIKILVKRLRDTNEKLREKAKAFDDDTGGLIVIDKEKYITEDGKMEDQPYPPGKDKEEKSVYQSDVILKDLGFKE